MVILACLLAGDASWADAPLLDDGTIEVHSRNRIFVARPGPKEGSTRVSRELLGIPSEFLWQMPGWDLNSYLSDDGQYMVVGYWGGALLDLKCGPDEVMLRFVKTGHLLATVRLRDLLRDLGSLRRTVSHYHWGEYAGFVGPTRFAVDTVEGRRLEFDVTTGKLVTDEASPKPNVQTSDDALPAPRPKDRKKPPLPRRRP